MNQLKELKDYLGVWKYTRSADLYFRVVPTPDKAPNSKNNYQVTWGDALNRLDDPKRMHIVDAPEAFRRIRAKARGGYTLIEPYTGALGESANLKVEDLYPNKPAKQEAAPKPAAKRFNFLDWLAER